MVEFWNDMLTQKSFEILLELKKKPFRFILIGGWAAYFWTKMHKSKDIDIVLFDISELDYLKRNYTLKKNDHLQKYEIEFGEIDLDIYAPYFSKLAIPVEKLKNYATKIEGIDVVTPEALLILKQGAEINRKDSVKGSKDQIDIMALLFFCEIDFKKYQEILKEFNLLQFYDRLKTIIAGFKEIKYLNLNPREFKLRKKEVLERLAK